MQECHGPEPETVRPYFVQLGDRFGRVAPALGNPRVNTVLALLLKSLKTFIK